MAFFFLSTPSLSPFLFIRLLGCSCIYPCLYNHSTSLFSCPAPHDEVSIGSLAFPFLASRQNVNGFVHTVSVQCVKAIKVYIQCKLPCVVPNLVRIACMSFEPSALHFLGSKT